METTTQFNSYVKLEAEAVDNYSNNGGASDDAVSDSVAAEDAQQLALEQATQDMDLACASLKISPDPAQWNFDDVRRWLMWTIEHYNLPDGSVDVNLFAVNGATLCAWSEFEFIMRSTDCGEILNTLLDVWKSTGRMRRNNNTNNNNINIAPLAASPVVPQQQQQTVIKREIMVMQQNYHTSYPGQFNHQQQFSYQPQHAMSYMPSPPPPPPPTYVSTMMMMQQQQLRAPPPQKQPSSSTLFFNASSSMGGGDSASSPPMAMFGQQSMYSSMQQQHRLPPMTSYNNNISSSQQQQQLFMGNIMPTPSPSNSTGNYGSDDCESLESYDMRTAAAAVAAAAAACASSSSSSPNGMTASTQPVQCNVLNNSVVVGHHQQHNLAAVNTNVALYDKYYGNPPGQANIHLWQFLKELLSKPDVHSTCIRWVDRSKGVFKIEDSVRVARLWGKRKNRPAMNYDKLSRSIRQYYKKGIMKKTEKSQRLVYQFCHPYCC